MTHDRRPPRPRGRIRVAGTLAAAARVYAKQARVLVPAAVLLFAPLGLVGVLVGDVDSRLAAADAATAILVWVEATAQFAALALGEVFFSGLVVAVVAAARAGEGRPTIRDLARRLPWGRLLLADLIITFGTALGLVLLVVPGVVFFAWFAFAAPLIEIEGLQLGPAFRRSRRLVRGHFWPVLLLAGGSYLGSSAVATAAEEGDLLPIGHSLLADWLTVAAADILLTPVVAIITVVLAYELKGLEDAAPAPGRA